MKNFTDTFYLHLSDTDATGMIFFPKLFEKCVIVLEKYLMSHDIHTFFLKSELGFPVINATGHYYKPVKLYERLKCQLRVSHMGQTSVQFNYKFINDLEELTFEATLVQVCIDNHTKLKKELPDFLIQVFSLIYEK